VKNIVAKEQLKLELELEKDLKVKSRSISPSTTSLPLEGLFPQQIISLMSTATDKENCTWETGRVVKI
jgi:hypothetical protein